MFDKVIIIGLGLIGGSLAKICKKNKIAKKIIGFDINKNQENFAIINQIIDDLYQDQKISDDDLLIIATPLSCYKEIFTKIKPTINNCLIIDVGSVKGFTIQLATEILQEKSKNFVACHPIAGSEKSGVANASENLFLGKKVIICEDKISDKNFTKKAELFWQKIGCNIEFIDAKEHDKIFALVSHLPQFLSFIAKENIEDEVLKNHLRLQNSNPKIWQEIFSLNRANIENYLGFYLKNIEVVIDWLNLNKFEKVETFLDSRFRGNENSLYVIPAKAGIREVLVKRITLISCFLHISDIEKFKYYAGTGFKDFIDIPCPTSPEILKDHQKSLIQFLESIKSKISNYVFI